MSRLNFEVAFLYGVRVFKKWGGKGQRKSLVWGLTRLVAFGVLGRFIKRNQMFYHLTILR